MTAGAAMTLLLNWSAYFWMSVSFAFAPKGFRRASPITARKRSAGMSNRACSSMYGLIRQRTPWFTSASLLTF